MMFRSVRFSHTLILTGLAIWFSVQPSFAAEAEFVGVLSLAVEDEAVQQLGLSPEVVEKLKKIIQEREDAVAELVLQIQKLPPAERADKLQPFVAESERMGLALLTDAQKVKLQKMQLAQRGLAAVADPQVAAKIGLRPEQIESLQQLQAKMQDELKGATERERFLIRAKYERQIIAVFDMTQRGNWEVLTGKADANQAPPPPAVVEKPLTEEKPPTAEKPLAVPMADPATRPVVPVNEPWFPEKGKDAPAANAPMNPMAPMAEAVTKPAAPPAVDPSEKDKEKRLRFNFRYAPWKDVLDWFAKQADMSLVMDAAPQGTFNYSDQRAYNTAEAIDLLNSVLLTKGYTIIRRGRMILLHNLEDEINPNSVPQIVPDDLQSKGEYELVCCLFTLNKMTPEEAEGEIRKLLGPQGKLVVLKASRQIYVTEIAGKLRLIHRIIQAVENPTVPKDEKVVVVPLKHTTPTAFMTLARPLLGIPENTNAVPDGSLRLSIDEPGGRLLVTGKPERLERLNEIVKLIDLSEGKLDSAAGPIESPQLEVYSIPSADPNGTLAVLQTLLSGQPDVRLAIDSKTGNLVALARPTQHATIRATLDQLQRDGRHVEVIRLRRIEPQAAVLAINKLFGIDDGKESLTAPKIDSDPNSMSLMIRGSQAQIENIRELLKKMGETGESIAEEKLERSNVRVLPFTGRAANSALDQIEFLWPTMRENRIRIVTPSKSPRNNGEVPQRSPNSDHNSPSGLKQREETKSERDARVFGGPKATFVSQLAPPSPQTPPAEKPAAPAEGTESTERKSRPGAEIVITQGPGGLIITSDDLDALDEFEALFKKITDTTARTGKEFTVFYLKFAKADAAGELLKEAIGAGASDSGGGGGGSLFGDLASSVLGDSGGLLGGLLGLGGGGSRSAPPPPSPSGITIIPDLRLNAILVHASSRDLDAMEQLLKVIDQPSSPEDVQTVARPRIIKCMNTQAEDIAAVLKQVYMGRLAVDSSQARQPSPQELIQALRGGGGRGGAGQQQQQKKTEEQKVTIGVDTRTNSLVVSAPEYLFMEIKELVDRLDTAVTQADESVRVVTLKRTNPLAVQQTISAVLGDQVTTTTPPTGAAASAPRPPQGAGGAARGGSGTRPQGGAARPPAAGGGQNRSPAGVIQQLQRGGTAPRTGR